MNPSLHDRYCLIKNRNARFVAFGISLWILCSPLLARTNADPWQGKSMVESYKKVMPWLPSPVIWVLLLWMTFAFLHATFKLVRESEVGDEKLFWGSMGALFLVGVIRAFIGDAAARFITVPNFVFGVGCGVSSLRIALHNRHAATIDSDELVTRSRIESAGIYFVFLLISTAGAALVALIGVRVIVKFANFVTPGSGTYYSQILFSPFYPLQLIAGFLLGYIAVSFVRTRGALWVWIPPVLIVLICLLLYQPQSVFQNWWPAAIVYFFGSCELTECFNRAIAVAPLFSSVAFSFGAWGSLRLHTRGEK